MAEQPAARTVFGAAGLNGFLAWAVTAVSARRRTRRRALPVSGVDHQVLQRR
ncbi:hypothetical protein ABZY93_14675 [Streptomyces smyrnaeus]|uniref:hypothetical protein n=1 Tax=Streptomyces smyrnaeus TaxID=1387713 RepID=UPI0033A802DF